MADHDPDGQKLLDAIAKETIAAKLAHGDDTVNDFYAQMQHYEKMDQCRNQLLDALLKRAATQPASQASP